MGPGEGTKQGAVEVRQSELELKICSVKSAVDMGCWAQ